MTKVLDLHQITKIYGQAHTAVKAVDQIDLELNQSEITLIMGPSGSGKTTLLSIAGGILRPSQGEVVLTNINLTKLSEEELPKIRLAKIGFVFQAFNLIAALTALENVQFVAELAGLKSSEAQKKSVEILSGLKLSERLNNLPADLSGGEKQRVAIARALVNDPLLILADEPTANLDSKTGHEVMRMFHDIAKNQGKTVLIVSHDNRIRDIADRILWLEDGRFKKLERMVIDPVCQMEIEKSQHKFNFKGENFYFCSLGCLSEFRSNPEHYVGTNSGR